MEIFARWVRTASTCCAAWNIGCHDGAMRAGNLLPLRPTMQSRLRAPERIGSEDEKWTNEIFTPSNLKPSQSNWCARVAARKIVIQFAGWCARKRKNFRAAPAKRTKNILRMRDPTWCGWMKWLRAENAGSVLS